MRIVDLYRAQAGVDDLNASGIVAYVDTEMDEIVAADSHDHAITQQPDGFFLRLLSPTEERVAELRALGWGDTPRQVWQ
ncbi:MAG TPA: hypothetical protein DCW68_06845 [Rhodospirillaceae bacterium]|nr:MAG: hypothetical protein A2018_01355 [Alphaproteobacteria bacterium GWF2_58_20]HAU29805.1 hypothetical protein [Rhodospirillaceae bacterium]